MDLAYLSDSKRIILALSVFVLALSVMLFVKRQLWRRMRRFLADSERTWDKALLDKLSRPVQMLLWLVAFTFSLQCLPESLRGHTMVILVSKALYIGTLGLIVNTVITVGVRTWGAGSIGESTRTLVLTIFRASLLALAALIILDTAGISITPILASLGVGSVAVALALQDTLSNFFSGIHILLDKPIRVGDFVRFEGNIEGIVREIGWRSTHIQLGSNNTVVIPNSKLSSSVLTNFNLPIEETSVPVKCGVAYESDLARVERVAIEVAREVLERTPGAIPTFQPVVRFENLADSAIEFTVVLRARRYEDSGLLRHEMIKALHARFGREGIAIPFPQRVVHIAGSIPSLS